MEDGHVKGAFLRMSGATENIFPPFNFDTVGGILIHVLLNDNVFWKPKELLEHYQCRNAP
jgi:hypothetical protein